MFQESSIPKICGINGLPDSYTLPYMPKTNSYSEGLVKQMKRALRTHDDRHLWVDRLPLVTLRLRAGLHTTARVSPAQAAFALNIRLPGQFFNYSGDVQTESPRVQEMLDFFRTVNPIRPRWQRRSWFSDPRLINCTHVYYMRQQRLTP